MAYLQHDKSPGGGDAAGGGGESGAGGISPQQQTQFGRFEEGIEPVIYQHGQYPEHYHPQEPLQVHQFTPETKSDAYYSPGAAAGANNKTFGITKKVFWILVGLLVLLLVLVIGLGAGLGAKVAQADSRSAAQSSSATSSASSSSSTTPLPTSTYTSPSSTATPTIPCPSQNLTLYTATTSQQAQFRLYCGIDFGAGEADDLGNLNTVSMEACMDACASTYTCQGAGWGTTGQLSDTAYTCYLKTNLTTAHSATDGWCLALNLNTTSSLSITI